jgi:probable rRNA maturation factor
MNSVRAGVAGGESLAWLPRASEFAAASLSRLGREDWELSIMFGGDDFIRDLNRRYRGKDEATDVLSFAQGEGGSFPGIPGQAFVAGDIAISLEALDRAATEFSVDRNEELKRLIVHGILHLDGMDHGRKTLGGAEGGDAIEDGSDAAGGDDTVGGDETEGGDMLALQERLLAEFSEVRII